jgi:hypothetical protein
VDATVKAVLSKTLGTTTLFQRLHVNLDWTHNTDAAEGERDDRLRAVLGHSVRLGPDTVLIADFVREQERERGMAMSLIEVGARRQLTPLTVLSAGIGFGVTDESPDVRLLVGYQRSF